MEGSRRARRLGLLAASVAAGAAVVGYQRTRRTRPTRPSPGIGTGPGLQGGRDRDGGALGATGRMSRQAEVARMGARLGANAAANRARWVFASAQRKTALNQELELRTAEDVATTLGNMKGVLMKLGQLASFVDDGMPAAVRSALEQLQSDAPPMSAELAAGVVERELGAPPDRL